MWARACSTATRSRSFARPSGVCWRWRSSASSSSSGWMETLRPLLLAVHRCRRGRRAGAFGEVDGPAGPQRQRYPGGAGQPPGGEVEGELVFGEPAAGVADAPGLAVDRQAWLAVADQV